MLRLRSEQEESTRPLDIATDGWRGYPAAGARTAGARPGPMPVARAKLGQALRPWRTLLRLWPRWPRRKDAGRASSCRSCLSTGDGKRLPSGAQQQRAAPGRQGHGGCAQYRRSAPLLPGASGELVKTLRSGGLCGKPPEPPLLLPPLLAHSLQRSRLLCRTRPAAAAAGWERGEKPLHQPPCGRLMPTRLSRSSRSSASSFSAACCRVAAATSCATAPRTAGAPAQTHAALGRRRVPQPASHAAWPPRSAPLQVHRLHCARALTRLAPRLA